MSESKDYVLGTDQAELERLRLQHGLWAEELKRIWIQSNYPKSGKFLELGCGPGFTTVDWAQFLGPQAQITAVDQSKSFLNFLDSQNHPRITTIENSIEALSLPFSDYDGAFCRWLMIFIPDINRALQQVHQYLRSGAIFALQEYVTYESFALVPETPLMKIVLDAIFRSWQDQGGYPNQGRRLTLALEKAGFDILHIEPVAKVCRPQEPLWQWPETFFKTFLPRLVSTGYLSLDHCTRFLKDWEQAKSVPGAYCVAPTVVNIIARKR